MAFSSTPSKRLLLSCFVLPVIAYIGVLCFYPLPSDAKDDGVMQIFVGAFFSQLCMGIIIAAPVAWVLHRITDRPWLATGISFSLLLVLLCGITIYGSKSHSDKAAAAPSLPVQSVLNEFQPAGFSVVVPTDWRRVPRAQSSTIAHWSNPGQNNADVESQIELKLHKVKPGFTTVEEATASFAKHWGGRVLDEVHEVDGALAAKVKVDQLTPDLNISEGLITIHDGRLYVLVMLRKAGNSQHQNLLEEIRSNWKWIPAESPSDYLELEEEPFQALEGKVSFRIPAVMARYPIENPAETVGLEIVNFVRGAWDVGLTVGVGKLPQGGLDGAKLRITNGMRLLKGFRDEIVWKPLSSEQRTVTTPIRVVRNGTANWIMWGIVEGSNQNIALLTITIADLQSDQRDKYVLMAEQMMETFTFQDTNMPPSTTP